MNRMAELMDDVSSAAQFIGVTCYGPRPIRRVDLRLMDHVSIFYGVNGAGKTALLNGVRSAFTGRRSKGESAEIHIQIPDPALIQWPATPFLRELHRAVWADYRRRW